MTPQDLIAAFEVLAEAPEGVKRLRELVLQLAVRGKLVPQDPGDEPAAVLLERIAAEKFRLMKEGEIRNSNPLRPVAEHESPFPVPASWEMVPFGDAFLTVFTGPFGTSLKKSEYLAGGTPVVNPQNLRDGCIEVTPDTCVGPTTLARLANFAIEARDLVVARRGEMGRCAVVTVVENGWLCGTGSLVLRPPSGLFPDFAAIYLRSPWTVTRLSGESVGSTMLNLNQRIMLNLPFGLPPLAEQHRIVARVEELMGLLDRLEAARNARETTRAALRDAALAALQNADSPDEVEVAWQRIAEGMDDLFTDPADVKPLRQAVLQLAVRGKLVPQDPADEPASALLERIATEKARLVKEGKIRKSESLPPIAKDELPFEVPANWEWSRLGELVVEGPTNGWSPQGVDFQTGVKTLKLSATTRGIFDGAHSKFVDAVLEPESPLWLKPGDLLIQRSNTPDYVGMAAVYYGGVREFIYPDLMMRCRVAQAVNVEFVHKALVAPASREWFRSRASGTSQSMVKLNQAAVQATPVPVPPAAEQTRIISKVDELTQLLDKLAQRLQSQRDLQDAFAAAAVHHLEV